MLRVFELFLGSFNRMQNLSMIQVTLPEFISRLKLAFCFLYRKKYLIIGLCGREENS